MSNLPNIVGLYSITCWVVVFTPQFYKTYKQKNGKGLSLLFLIIWLIGDIYSFTGAIIEELLPTVIWLGVYHAIADILLILQVSYYRWKSNQPVDDISESDEYLPLLTSQDDEVPDSKWLKIANFLSIFFVFLCYSSVMLYFMGISRYMGWTSAILYIVSRIPQIMKNAESQSVEGLSPWIFFVGIMGNLSFCASILLQSTAKEHLLTNLPWLVGSGGTLFFDFFIWFQFHLYG